MKKVLYDIQPCVLLHATNLNNVFCKKLSEKSTRLRDIENLARHLIWICLEKCLAALNRFLYSEKAPYLVFRYLLCIY